MKTDDYYDLTCDFIKRGKIYGLATRETPPWTSKQIEICELADKLKKDGKI